MKHVRANELTTLGTAGPYPGFNELRCKVRWGRNPEGHRFFHVSHPPVPPSVTETVEAAVLLEVSDGLQAMTSHALLEHQLLVVQVWSDVDTVVEGWELAVVPLAGSADLGKLLDE